MYAGYAESAKFKEDEFEYAIVEDSNNVPRTYKGNSKTFSLLLKKHPPTVRHDQGDIRSFVKKIAQTEAQPIFGQTRSSEIHSKALHTYLKADTSS
jgi:hypothetical protein